MGAFPPRRGGLGISSAVVGGDSVPDFLGPFVKFRVDDHDANLPVAGDPAPISHAYHCEDSSHLLRVALIVLVCSSPFIRGRPKATDQVANSRRGHGLIHLFCGQGEGGHPHGFIPRRQCGLHRRGDGNEAYRVSSLIIL